MYRKYPILLLTIFLLCSIDFLQAGMIAFASIPISGEIAASPQEYSLIAACYACVAVIVISKQRWLVERTGWRYYILGSIAVFIVGAVVCALGRSVLAFTIGRVVMALGGASLMTSGRVLVNLIAPGPGRFVGINVFAYGVGAGTAAGPILAALAVSGDNWTAIFWILICVAVLTGVLANRCLPDDIEPPESRTHSSGWRVLLLGTGSFLLLYILQRAYYDYFNDGAILLGVGALALVATYMYFHGEHSHDKPLLKVRELMKPQYLAGVGVFSFCYVILGANNYMLPFFIQRGLGYSWQTTGLVESIGLAGAVLTWVVMGKLLPKYSSPRKFLVLGFLLLTFFGYRLSSMSAQSSVLDSVLPALLANGCFIMLVLATTAMQTFRDVSQNDTLLSHAQQIKNMLSQLCMAFGTAFATVLLQWRTTVRYDTLSSHMSSGNPAFSVYVEKLTAVFAQSFEPLRASQMAIAMLAQELSQQATLMASMDYFFLVACVGTIALVASIFQRVYR